MKTANKTINSLLTVSLELYLQKYCNRFFDKHQISSMLLKKKVNVDIQMN